MLTFLSAGIKIKKTTQLRITTVIISRGPEILANTPMTSMDTPHLPCPAARRRRGAVLRTATAAQGRWPVAGMELESGAPPPRPDSARRGSANASQADPETTRPLLPPAEQPWGAGGVSGGHVGKQSPR